MLRAAGAAGLLAVAIAGAPPLAQALTGRSLGALIAEHDGKVAFDRYDSTAQVPTSARPPGFPRSAAAITVAEPGPHAGFTDAYAIDARVPATESLPGSCTPSSTWSMPFELPDDWPRFTLSELRTCGSWTLAVRGGRWYAWTSAAGSRAPRQQADEA